MHTVSSAKEGKLLQKSQKAFYAELGQVLVSKIGTERLQIPAGIRGFTICSPSALRAQGYTSLTPKGEAALQLIDAEENARLTNIELARAVRTKRTQTEVAEQLGLPSPSIDDIEDLKIANLNARAKAEAVAAIAYKLGAAGTLRGTRVFFVKFNEDYACGKSASRRAGD